MSGKKSPYIFLVVLLAYSLIVPGASAEITYTFDLDTTGGAWYIIEYRTLLDSQDRVQEFDSFKSIVEGNSTHKLEYEQRMQKIVSQAGIVTGRPMTATDFDISISTTPETVTGSYGIVRYTFKWGEFVDIEDASMVVGDVFFGGLHISDDDSLVVTIPEGYKVTQVVPDPDKRSKDELVWTGPRTFSSGEPLVVLRQSSSWIWYGLLFVILIGAGLVLYQQDRLRSILKKPDNIDTLELESRPESEYVPESAPELEPQPKDIYQSDEEWIISLLKQHGRAMMQSEIVQQTGFSKSKTSSLLTALADKGRIQRVKKGRENLIRLI